MKTNCTAGTLCLNVGDTRAMIHRFSGRLLGSAALLAIIGAGSLSPAREAPAADVAPESSPSTFDDNDFDLWVYGTGGDPYVRRVLNERLTSIIASVDRACRISPAQRKRLELAGRGDIKRFFDRVEEKRQKFQLIKIDPDKITEFQQELKPLQDLIYVDLFGTGMFGNDSLFSKMLANALSPPQAAECDKALREAKRERFRTKVESVVATCNTIAEMREEQRRKLETVLMGDTRLLEKSDWDDLQGTIGRVASLDEAAMRPIFDDVQWRALSLFFREWKSDFGDVGKPENDGAGKVGNGSNVQ